jgi:signal transduction histidine kinase
MNNTTFENAKILIVDDQQANIDVLTGLLDIKGFTNYTSTTDSRNTKDLYEKIKPDLILLDLRMPYLNGFQVLLQLKSLIPPETFLPILVLTADISPESKQEALNGGASDFITKPFDLIEVFLRINNLLRVRSLHQQLKFKNQILEERVNERTLELQMTNIELISAKNKAEDMSRLKSIFLANMSHELRTPLISVLGFAELLQLELFDPQQLELVDLILQGGNRLNLTINSILEWTRLESENLSLIFTPSNLSAEINKNIPLFLKMAKPKRLTITPNVCDINLTVIIDVGLFDKILFQLLHNAIKFTEKGGVTITLNQNKKDEVDWAVIRITDTGIGIAKENLERIFAEFRQSSEGFNRSHEGSGLGLSIAKKMVELINGKIEIETEVNKGSTFSIWLPVLESNDASLENVIEKRKLNAITR